MNRKPFVRRTMTAALAAALIGATGAVMAASAGEPVDPQFAKYDVNRDGFVSREEAQKIRGFDKAFSEADDNRDGKLDAAEFVKAQSIHERVVAGQYVDDSAITAKVKAALLKDSKLKSLAVSVETSKGTVLLSGFVDNAEQQRRAAEVASGVTGVVTVKNALVVKS